jgi:hypothetical protein
MYVACGLMRNSVHILLYGRSPAGDRGFESHRGHGCLSVVSFVCCRVDVSATN